MDDGRRTSKRRSSDGAVVLPEPRKRRGSSATIGITATPPTPDRPNRKSSDTKPAKTVKKAVKAAAPNVAPVPLVAPTAVVVAPKAAPVVAPVATPEKVEYDPTVDPVGFLNNLPPLPKHVPPIRVLTKSEMDELETVLEFRVPGAPDEWKKDWGGNLLLLEKDILNPSVKSTGNQRMKTYRQSLISWAVKNPSPSILRLVHNLLSRVASSPDVPPTVQRLFGALGSDADMDAIMACVRRASYDPTILVEDGWTVQKSATKQGATGGPYLIGDMIYNDGTDAIVTAYIHDVDIGDLWKAMSLADQSSFDLEAEELVAARRKWEKRNPQMTVNMDAMTQSTLTTTEKPAAVSALTTSVAARNPRAGRNHGSLDFTVNGLEHGIVLAATYSKGARAGVHWPARVMHASEAGFWESGSNGSSRRTVSRQRVDVVFLSPFWRPDDGLGRALSSTDESAFNSIPLFQMESVEAVDDMIKEYPYAWTDGIDLAQLTKSFRFTGLPRAALPRYINAHRLAVALREYSKHHVKGSGIGVHHDKATAGLFETHPMSVKTPHFPLVVLHLPFDFILSQLPQSLDDRPVGSSRNGNLDALEPILNLNAMVEAMKPPYSWGISNTGGDASTNGHQLNDDEESSPASFWIKGDETGSEDESTHVLTIQDFMKDFPILNDVFNRYYSSPPLVGAINNLTMFLAQLDEFNEERVKELNVQTRRSNLKALTTSWATWKRLGEDSLSSLLLNKASPAISEWRRLAEKLYRRFLELLGDGQNVGSGLSIVISDTRCNGHRTSDGCVERPVRLPAALKGAKLAGAGSDGSTRLITSVPDKYIDLVESKFLKRAHSAQYLKRMKSRCAAASSDDAVIVLTDNSSGEGGTDTMGSRGTWLAAVIGVAAVVAAADMVVQGQCVNAFCMARPPGHHAGRSIHAMKAISNGFCVLNAVAVAALYAVATVADGGLGLGRVCVIDFDVHHGNGTQDILCSTYDPRFLYVSLHAGGPAVNGHPKDDDPNHELHDLRDERKNSGIYPGRCGDTSPHEGVLNIPMGAKVTSQAIGQVLIERVLPKVEAFSPDLLILSAGFDAHKSDPMDLGTLRAVDFGHITELACDAAFKACSGRVVSVLEGGYGVPCCRLQKDIFLPKPLSSVEPVRQENTPPVSSQPSGALTELPNDSTSVPTKSGDATNAQPPVSESAGSAAPASAFTAVKKRPPLSKVFDLGDDLPDDMDDQVPVNLQNRLEKCHAEGFVECICEHVKSLIQNNKEGR